MLEIYIVHQDRIHIFTENKLRKFTHLQPRKTIVLENDNKKKRLWPNGIGCHPYLLLSMVLCC